MRWARESHQFLRLVAAVMCLARCEGTVEWLPTDDSGQDASDSFDGGALVHDAGTVIDAGQPQPGTDAGFAQFDAGSMRDGGSVTDAGSGMDAGVAMDSGSGSDAGSSHDAGSPLDAGLPAWVPGTVTLTAGESMEIELADTLPSEVMRGGVFGVDPAGAPLPPGVTLSADGKCSAAAASVSSMSNVIFTYVEP